MKEVAAFTGGMILKSIMGMVYDRWGAPWVKRQIARPHLTPFKHHWKGHEGEYETCQECGHA